MSFTLDPARMTLISVSGDLQSTAHHPGCSSHQPVFAISCRRYRSSNVNKYTVGTGQYGGTVCAIDEHVPATYLPVSHRCSLLLARRAALSFVVGIAPMVRWSRGLITT